MLCLAGCSGYAPGTFQTRDEKLLDQPGIFSGPDGRLTKVCLPDQAPASGSTSAGASGAAVAAGAGATASSAAATQAPPAEFETVSEQPERVILADGTVVERRTLIQQRPASAP